jgi:hypothetical protein
MTSWMRASPLRSRGYLQSLFFRVYPAPPFMPFRLCTPDAHLMTPSDHMTLALLSVFDGRHDIGYSAEASERQRSVDGGTTNGGVVSNDRGRLGVGSSGVAGGDDGPAGLGDGVVVLGVVAGQVVPGGVLLLLAHILRRFGRVSVARPEDGLSLGGTRQSNVSVQSRGWMDEGGRRGAGRCTLSGWPLSSVPWAVLTGSCWALPTMRSASPLSLSPIEGLAVELLKGRGRCEQGGSKSQPSDWDRAGRQLAVGGKRLMPNALSGHC